MHARADCRAVAAKSWQLRSAWANVTADGRQGGETLSCLWRRSAAAPTPSPMSLESAPLTGRARASPVLGRALTFRGRCRQNRLQIAQTRFPVGGALPASPSRIPVLSLPGAPCDAPRRIGPAITVSARIARPGRPTDPSPNAVRFDQAARERLACRSAENPTSPREQFWQFVPLSARPERSPHNYRRQCGTLPSPWTDRTARFPAIVAARRVQS